MAFVTINTSAGMQMLNTSEISRIIMNSDGSRRVSSADGQLVTIDAATFPALQAAIDAESAGPAPPDQDPQ